jgi:hypothetical protein
VTYTVTFEEPVIPLQVTLSAEVAGIKVNQVRGERKFDLEAVVYNPNDDSVSGGALHIDPVGTYDEYDVFDETGIEYTGDWARSGSGCQTYDGFSCTFVSLPAHGHVVLKLVGHYPNDNPKPVEHFLVAFVNGAVQDPDHQKVGSNTDKITLKVLPAN